MIRLAVLENDNQYLQRLEKMLTPFLDISIVYKGPLQSKTILPFAHSQPDMVLMDIDSLNGDGANRIYQIKKSHPNIQILILTADIQDDNIINIIRAGASGYILKNDEPKIIIDAIEALHKGESPLHGRVARTVLNHVNRQGIRSIDGFLLTKREREIAVLLLEGLAYKEIADRCHISMDTAFSHARKVFEKLGVKSRSELAARYKS